MILLLGVGRCVSFPAVSQFSHVSAVVGFAVEVGKVRVWSVAAGFAAGVQSARVPVGAEFAAQIGFGFYFGRGRFLDPTEFEGAVDKGLRFVERRLHGGCLSCGSNLLHSSYATLRG